MNDQTIACSAFNSHFKAVFTKDHGRLPHFSLDLPPVPDISISEHGVFNLLRKFYVKKSMGPDGIYNAFLKQYSE